MSVDDSRDEREHLLTYDKASSNSALRPSDGSPLVSRGCHPEAAVLFGCGAARHHLAPVYPKAIRLCKNAVGGDSYRPVGGSGDASDRHLAVVPYCRVSPTPGSQIRFPERLDLAPGHDARVGGICQWAQNRVTLCDATRAGPTDTGNTGLLAEL